MTASEPPRTESNYGDRVPGLSQSFVRPSLQPIDWKAIDHDPPRAIDLELAPDDPLPKASQVVITWTASEWAALEHVLCGRASEMPGDSSQWAGWQDQWTLYQRGYDEVEREVREENADAPSLSGRAWGRYRLVSLAPGLDPVLLVKSDMHVGTDGPSLPLGRLIERIVDESQPDLVLTIGTAGGARREQCLGAVAVSSSFLLELSDDYRVENGLFTSSYAPCTKLLEVVRERLFRTVPVTPDELEDLACGIGLPLGLLMNETIDPHRLRRQVDLFLERGDSGVERRVPVYTSNSYDVATTSGSHEQYSCLEMGDAFVAKTVAERNPVVRVGSVRSISDPTVTDVLARKERQAWATQLYETYGLYTSLNGALATWALLVGDAARPIPRHE